MLFDVPRHTDIHFDVLLMKLCGGGPELMPLIVPLDMG